MDDLKSSRTALITCLMRTIHTRLDHPPIIDDPWADQLVTAAEADALARQVRLARDPNSVAMALQPGEAYTTLHEAWHAMPIYCGVILRTRYTEDLVQAALQQGIRQYVIVGAGMDGFALRHAYDRSDLQVFEVDHPASQQLKIDRITRAGRAPVPKLHFVPADLSRQGLREALEHSPFRFDQPAIFSWLGVTVYLTREANLATLRGIANCAAPGSELVFTYIEQSMLDSDSPIMRRAKAVAASLGEPWLSGFESADLPRLLADIGFEIVEDLSSRQMFDRYCADRKDGLTPGRAGRIARVRITPR